MKNTNKRILSFVLSALMLISLLPAGMMAGALDAMNATNTIYVDQAKGSDTNTGTESSPVKTIEKAVELLEAGDKTADGYIYLKSDYSQLYDGRGQRNFLDIMPTHTRNIIVTGNANKKPTWEMIIACSASTSAAYLKERHLAASGYIRNNGPLTLDVVKVNVKTDPNNLTTIALKMEYEFPAGHEFAGKKLAFKGGDYLYKKYDLAIDPNNAAYVIDVTDRTKENEVYPVRMNDLRWTTNAKFVATENCEVTYEDQADNSRLEADIPTTSSHVKEINYIYFQPYSNASLYGGFFGDGWVVGASATYDDEVILTIGSKDALKILRAPSADVPATTKVSYVFETPDVFNIPFYTSEKTNAPALKCEFSMVLKTTGVTYGTGASDIAELYTSYVDGFGTYNIVFDNPAETFDQNLLLPGYHSLYFKGIGGSLSFDFESLPQVGYKVIRIDEGDILDLQGTTVQREFMLDIVKAGKSFENDSFPVIYADDESVLDFITLTEEAEALGSLVYSEDDYAVYYTLDRGNVVYEKGDTDEDVEMPADSETVFAGENIIVSAPVNSTLENGKKFSGWKDAKGNIYQPGDSYMINSNGSVTLTATWGFPLSFVTGYEDAATPVTREDMFFVPGDRVALPNDLRASDEDKDGVYTLKTITDGGKDYVFYGWTIDGKFYHAGETIKTGTTAITATAVWIPAIYVKPSYAGNDSDGSKAKPYNSILKAQMAVRALFGADEGNEIPAASIVMMENTIWNWSYTETVPGHVGGVQDDGYTYYEKNSANANHPKLNTLGGSVLYTAISSDIEVLMYQYESLYFYIADDFMLDNLTYLVSATHSISRLYFTTTGRVLYMGPTVKCLKKNNNTQNVDTLYGLPLGSYSATVHQQYSYILFDVNLPDITAHIYGGEYTGLYMLYANAGTNTSYIGAPGTTGPTIAYTALGNTNNHPSAVWDYYQYSGNVKEFRFGVLSTANNIFRGTWNLHFYGNAKFTLKDWNAAYAGNVTDRKANQQTINLYFEDCDAEVTTNHQNTPHQATIATSKGATLGDDYYNSSVSGANTIYYYSATNPSGISSISLKNSNVEFVNPLYVRSGAGVSFSQDENSSYVGNIYATKDTFVKGEGNVYTPVEVTQVLSGMGVKGQAISTCFNGEKWVRTYAFNYETGYDSVKIDGSFGGFAGNRIVLSDALRGQVVTDAGKELTFFGWNIDGKFYDAGDGYVLGESDATATAVWVPAIFVDPTYAGGNSDGSKAKPFVKVADAYAALKTLLASSDAVGGAVYLLSDAVMDAEPDTSFAPVSNIPSLEDAGKPVLFTAANKTIKFTTDNESYSNTLHFLGSVMFDNLTLRVKGTTFIRLTPAKDAYFGPNFAFEQPSGYRVVYLDGQNQNVEEVTYKIYNGTFSLVCFGSNFTKTTYAKQNVYVGTGESTSAPTVSNLFANTIATFVNAKVELRSGTVTNAILGTNYGNAAYSNAQPFGEWIYVVYNGMNIGNIRDAYSDGANQIPATTTYCANLTRTLIFDGYKGNIAYNHFANTNETVVNGINNVSFIGGAQVNFTTNDVVVTSGSVYVEEGSSYTGKAIKGSCIHEGNEVQVALTPANGLNTWNSDKDHTWTTDVYGAALGAQIRVEAPYGIRFGFNGSTTALEAMLGQAVAEKGVLIIRDSMLDGALTLDTENVLKIVANKAYSLTQSAVFTGVLVDTPDAGASSKAWLETWKDVDFTARAYFKLADGSVIYSNSDTNSIAAISASLVG